MSKAKMMYAKDMIQTKQYDEARKILKTVNHPTAREWEAKLDRIAPIRKAPRYTLKKTLLLIIAVVLTITIVLFVLNRINLQNRINNAMIGATVDLKLMCDFGTRLGTVRCEQYARQTLNRNPEWALDVELCGSIWSSITEIESFASCLVRHDVPLPV